MPTAVNFCYMPFQWGSAWLPPIACMKTLRPTRRSRNASIELLEARIAPAATVSVTGGNLLVQDTASAGDHITFSFNSGNYFITDPGGVNAGSGANSLNGTTVTVAASSFPGLVDFDLGEVNNSLALSTATGALNLKGLLIDTATLSPLPALSLGTSGVAIKCTASDLTIGGVVTSGSDVNLIAVGHAINVNANFSTSGDIALNASVITASGGATVSANNVGLNVSADVGSTLAPLLVTASTLASSQTSGNVYVASTGAITVGSFSNAGIVFTGSGLAASGGIVLQASGAITLAADISTSIGDVDLQSTADIFVGTHTVSAGSTAFLTADIGGQGTGQITTGSTGLITAPIISLSAAQGISVNLDSPGGGIAINNTTSGSVVLTNSGGSSDYIGHFSGVSDLTLNGNFHVDGGSVITPRNFTVNGDLGIDSTLSIGSLSGTGSIHASIDSPAGIAINAPAGSATFSGSIGDSSAPFSVTKTGPGTEIFSGAGLSYSGTTTVNSGTLEFDAPNSGASPITLGGGTLRYNIVGPRFASESIGTITLTADSTVDVAANVEFDWTEASFAGGNFKLTKTGSGFLNDFHATGTSVLGSIDVQGGAIGTDTSAAFGKAAITIEDGAALWLSDSPTLANPITASGAGQGVSSPFAAPGAILNLGSSIINGPSPTLTGAITLAGDTTFGSANGGLIFNGVISGAHDLVIDGTNPDFVASPVVLKNTHNSFGSASGTITIKTAILVAPTNSALGNAGNEIVFGDDYAVFNPTGTIPRHLVKSSSVATIEADSTVTLTGLIDGPGTLVKAGAGTLLFGSGFTGPTTITSGNLQVSGTVLTVGGGGNVTVDIEPNGSGGQKIQSVDISGTTGDSKITITGPKTGTVTINQITSTDGTTELGTLAVSKNVIIGSGDVSATPAIAIAGKVDNLKLFDINANAVIQLGTGLSKVANPDPSVPTIFNNAPNVNFRDILGAGVILEVTDDGLNDGFGGGGLGKVKVNSWAYPGTVATTESIGSFTLSHGDCYIDFKVDPNHMGGYLVSHAVTANGTSLPDTTSNIGSIVIQNGNWGSSNSEIQGTVGSFSARAFLAGASISAGNISKFLLKSGDYAGTMTLTDPGAAGLKSFTVNGNFTGYVQAAASIINVNVKGNFKGSLQAASIGNIGAYAFEGATTGDLFGDADKQNIVATSGSLGTLKTSAGGVTNYDIAVDTTFKGFSIKNNAPLNGAIGINNVNVDAGNIVAIAVKMGLGTNVVGIENSVFETNSRGTGTIGTISSTHSVIGTTFAAGATIGSVAIGSTTNPTAALTDSLILAGTNLANGDLGGPAVSSYTGACNIKGVTVKGAMTASTIAAGIDPVDGIYGNGNDLAAAGSPILPATTAIGTLIFGAGSGTSTNSPAMLHDNAIEAASIKSMAIGTAKAIKLFNTPQFLRLGGSEAASDVLVQILHAVVI